MDAMEGVKLTGTDPSKYPVPIETIYVHNLEERVKIDELKTLLTAIFAHYGTIVDIVAKRSLKRKGQAFVVFDNQDSATRALEMNGFILHGKPIKVALAKTHSDETLKTKASEELFEQHKRERLTLKERKVAEEAQKILALPTTAVEKPRPAKTGAAAVPDEYVRPNKTLFLQNIPKEVTADDLTAIFERFEGFKEVRFLAAKAVGFAEFENEQFAITAKESTANMPIGTEGKPMKVTYQRQHALPVLHQPLPAKAKTPKPVQQEQPVIKQEQPGKQEHPQGGAFGFALNLQQRTARASAYATYATMTQVHGVQAPQQPRMDRQGRDDQGRGQGRDHQGRGQGRWRGMGRGRDDDNPNSGEGHYLPY